MVSRAFNRRVAATAGAMGLIAVAAATQANMLSLPEFVAFIAGASSLGVVSSILLTLIRLLVPKIDADIAMLSSFFVAVLFSVIARAIMPFVTELPPGVGEYWPAVVWLAQQVWYYLTKPQVVDQ